VSDANTGRFVWHHLLTSNPKEALPFYAEVVGWTAEPLLKGYTMFVSSQGPHAGTVKLPLLARTMGVPPHWTSNVQVEDVDAAVMQVRKLGGRVYIKPSGIPKVGRLAVIADPQGAPLNLFKPDEPMKLHDSSKSGEFTWHELITTDHESAFRFYSALFGWERLRDLDLGAMGAYVIYGVGGVELGGMFTKPKDARIPPMWMYYVRVANLDASLERAKARGARVLHGPSEVAGGARIVQLTDPQGAPFALHEAAKPTLS
jgi:predicted enzyme related to lactoylglutathione lyase